VKTAEEESRINKQRSKKAQRKYEKRKKSAKVEPALEEQFVSGRLLGMYNNNNDRLTAFDPGQPG